VSTFYLEIKMWNDAMQTARDVVKALLVVTDRLAIGQLAGKIYDANGNSVGTFGFRAAAKRKKEKP